MTIDNYEEWLKSLRPCLDPERDYTPKRTRWDRLRDWWADHQWWWFG